MQNFSSIPDVDIQVKMRYEPCISNAERQDYFFSYHITIENRSNFSIQLLYRQWEIFDIVVGKRKVEGPGVVGEQPIIPPHQKYSYESFCFLKYPLGHMKGSYDFINVDDGQTYKISIPLFSLYAPYLLN